MTATPRELSYAAELHIVLRELNNAAIEARPYVSRLARFGLEGATDPVVGDSSFALERLDAAIADAGETIAKVRS